MSQETRLEELPLGQLLTRVCRLSVGRMKVRMENVGLHRAQGFVLFYLWHHEEASQSDIARAQRISPATVTNTLQRMEKAGWIERHQDSNDQRVIRVRLTARAKALYEEARSQFREMEEEITATLAVEERENLRGYLLRIHERLVELSGTQAPDVSRASGEGLQGGAA